MVVSPTRGGVPVQVRKRRLRKTGFYDVYGKGTRKHFSTLPLELSQRCVMRKLKDSVPEWLLRTKHPPVIHPSKAMMDVAVRETTVYIQKKMIMWRKLLRTVIEDTHPKLLLVHRWDQCRRLPPIGWDATEKDLKMVNDYINGLPLLFPTLLAFSENSPPSTACAFCPCDRLMHMYRLKQGIIPRFFGNWQSQHDSEGRWGLYEDCGGCYETTRGGLILHMKYKLSTPQRRGESYDRNNVLEKGDVTDYYHLALQFFLAFVFPTSHIVDKPFTIDE